MKLIVNKDRSVIQVGTWGTKNENDFEIVDFEFPEELEGYNKRIVYLLGGGDNPWGIIRENKAYITSEITSKENVKGYVWCTKGNPNRPADTDFRSQEFDIPFYKNEQPTGVVPTPQQVDGFNEMLTEMNAKIDEVDALEQTIETAEAQRQEAEATRVSNENTRESNESTRQTNEQTRQTQEADRERRTNEAIENIEDKTAEYNANAETKTTAFNNNATQKTNDFNLNYTQKVNDFNTNATTQKTDFNTNASSKTSAFNSNAETKTNAFNTNATNKTNDFNSNATSKTSEFNTNAESKTSAFNDNATQKTTNFDNNASEKTDEFNTNAQEKIDEYDEHIVEYQAQIDELQEEVEELSENMPWNTTEQATEIQVTDAAKYSRNRMKILGNTEQQSYSGKNLFPGWNEGQINASTGEDIVAVNQYRSDYIEISINTDYYFSVEQLSSYYNYNFKIFKYDEEKSYLGMQSFGTGYTFRGVINITEADVRYIRIAETQALDKLVNTQLEIGTARTTYEPYTGCQPSPSPDYPQPIHVVTGENTIGVQGKNLFNKDGNISIGKYYDANGDKVELNNTWLSEDYIKVNPSTQYCMSGNGRSCRICCYDTNHNFISRMVVASSRLGITTPANCNYVRCSGDYGFDKVQLEQGSTATDYAPYYHADYPINLGSLELCKIGDYQDYLYKENGNWYKYGAIGKVILDGINNVFSTKAGNPGNVYAYGLTNAIPTPSNLTPVNVLVKYFKPVSYSDLGNYDTGITSYQQTTIVRCKFGANSNITTLELANTWLTTHNVPIYYPLATPTITQITDENLIAQLDAIYEHLQLVKGTNNITVTASDLKLYMELSYMQDLPSKLDKLDSRLALLE